jgi:hypothetical protein
LNIETDFVFSLSGTVHVALTGEKTDKECIASKFENGGAEKLIHGSQSQISELQVIRGSTRLS